MKIAFLSFYSGSVNRGVESFVHELAKRLGKHHQVTIYQAGESGGNAGYVTEQVKMDIDWTKKDMTYTIERYLFIDYWSLKIAAFSLRVFGKILKERYDIVVPLNGGAQSALIRIATLLYGGKMVVIGQSGIGWDDLVNLRWWPNVFVAISSKAKRWAKWMNPFARVEYIPNGVDLERFRPIKKKKDKQILCIGALTKAKRIDLAVKAVAEIEDVNLLVVGDGELREEIQALGTKLLGSRFKLTSYPYEMMPEVYQNADVFTIPSSPSHSFEIVLVEAMATNLPVVANNDPIRAEIVGDAGVLVDPTNIHEYSLSLKRAMNSNWGNKPREQAKKFDWNYIAKKYEDLFNSLV